MIEFLESYVIDPFSGVRFKLFLSHIHLEELWTLIESKNMKLFNI